ncbi:hypothetical protein [Fluviispira multicolorata]|uniref:Uncharacterized protein n=1 Tax=Fluviispira multicolorata TaxID=2654512 RepID=A0A833JHP9_9BACT|nr:hypothetical protein [Fluviispira multicolorata]KAB8033582.1 hypothetical protein GCL57_02420 [Fluviispira multicolorata]
MSVIQKFLFCFLIFSSISCFSSNSFADEASVYCATANGSRAWLPNPQIKKRILLDSSTALFLNNYNPPITVNGVWKSVRMGDKDINYFLIDGGKERIVTLRQDCIRRVGSNYIFVHPHHNSLSHNDYHLFVYLLENGSYQFETSYMVEYSIDNENFAIRMQ